MNLPEKLGQQREPVILAEALFLVLAIGVADYVTGYDVSLFVFYALPILLVVWFAGRVARISVCLACAIAWCIADARAGHPYSQISILVWNTAVQLGFFVFVMIAGSALKFRLDQTRAQVEQLERF